jgi:hypothetical protein
MRAGIVVNVTRADRRRLEAIVADRSAPQKHVWRANIILATADGCGTAEIMRRSGKAGLHLAGTNKLLVSLSSVYAGSCDSMARKCHRYSSVTCPNRRSTCLSLNLPISKSLVRQNATEPAWPNTFQSPCASCIAAAGLGQLMGSPAAIAPSTKSKGNATKEMISAIGSRRCADDHPGYCASRNMTSGFRPWQYDRIAKC